MAEESFEDPAVAEVLNDGFVPVKVDREERPDLDSIYQTVCQLVTGSGGWPLSVWLTPEGKPFYVGTYFPRESRHNRPGFLDLCERIADSWADTDDRAEMERRAEQWTDAARGELEDVPEPGDRTVPEGDVLVDAADASLRAADRDHGGFGSGGPKFPQPARLRALLRAHDRTGRDAYLEVVTETLDAMADGGMYDQLGGGFHRYSTDREWVVPHFEKMLYDNAEIPRAYLDAYRVTGDERYATVARETFAFVERELRHPEGGFYSTLDARSPVLDADPDDPDPEREEGTFYVWTPDQVTAVFDEDDAEYFTARFGVTPGGNFEGKTVLTRAGTVEDLASEFDATSETVRDRLDRVKRRAFEHRDGRPRPARDEKVLAGWNGLMLSALAEGALALDDDRYADLGAEALSFVREHLWDAATGRLTRRYKDEADAGTGDLKGRGYLEDYAFLGWGALTLFEATGDPDHLGFALDLARTIREAFYDPDAGTLYFAPADGEDLVTRVQEPRDQSTPSSLGVAVELFSTLDPFAPEEGFGEVAETVVGTHGPRVAGRPTEHLTLALATDAVRTGSLEVTLSGDPPAAWTRRLGRAYLPGRLLAHRPGDATGMDAWCDRLGLDAPGPVWADREARAGPTLYVCREFTCSPPLSDVADALEWVEDLAPEANGDDDGNGGFDGLT
jgi:uncharacterized protein YyaL (SSP411 family)